MLLRKELFRYGLGALPLGIPFVQSFKFSRSGHLAVLQNQASICRLSFCKTRELLHSFKMETGTANNFLYLVSQYEF